MSKIADSFKSAGSFLRDCRVEMGKITWPGRRELVESTKVVLAFIILVAIFVSLSDIVLGGAVKMIVR